MVAYSEAGPAWFENCELTHAMPEVRAFFDRHLSRALHDEMPHAVVAVQNGGAGMLVDDADVRPDVEPTGLDASCILRQPGHAVTVRPLQVGFGHQGCDG
jgi:hypothetical protein